MAGVLVLLAAPTAVTGPAEAHPVPRRTPAAATRSAPAHPPVTAACRSFLPGPVYTHVRRTAKTLTCAFHVRKVSGYRSWGGGDHPRGLAVDLYTTAAQGDRLAAHVRSNATRYRITYVMWNHRIWSTARADEGWRWVPDRGNPTSNHQDHVHISFKP